MGIVDLVSPWYLLLKPNPVYEANNAQAFWDVPLFAEHQEVRANRVYACVINHESKRVVTLEMSCPCITNWEKKEVEKTTKCRPFRWEIKQKYQGYELKQYNIIMDVLGGWCRDLEVKLKELVGSKSNGVLHDMQKAALSGTLNISRTFKFAT